MAEKSKLEYNKSHLGMADPIGGGEQVSIRKIRSSAQKTQAFMVISNM